MFEKCAREHSDLNTGNVLLKVVVKKENQHTSANCSLQKLKVFQGSTLDVKEGGLQCQRDTAMNPGSSTMAISSPQLTDL